MTRMHTWAKMLLALLILPVVAVGGAVSVCTCHHEPVHVGSSCGCGHGHIHEGEPQKEQPQEHRCAHVENEMQPVSAQIQLPIFDWAEGTAVQMPDFHWCLSRMHSLVAMSLERTWLWDPPDTRLLPLLI